MRQHFRWPIGRVERVARRVYWETARRLGFEPIIISAQGARFVVDPGEHIDRGIALDGIWAGPQLEELAAVCGRRKIDWFIDGGASSGFYCVMFAAKRLASHVVAFEPDPINYAHLMANIHLNGLAPRIKALELALGDRAGDVLLHETHVVKQVRFDERYSITGRSLVVKLDVEGHEFEALAGMAHTLVNNACYVQVALRSQRLDDLKALFARAGYVYLHSRGIDHIFTNMKDEASRGPW